MPNFIKLNQISKNNENIYLDTRTDKTVTLENLEMQLATFKTEVEKLEMDIEEISKL